jgi:uncharacterized LabA/DUF88 family protein
MKNPNSPLDGLRLLALADVDNLAVSSFRFLDAAIDPLQLRRRLAWRARKLTAAAVLTTRSDLHYTTEEWSEGGWEVTPIIREYVQTFRGEELRANADFDIAFEAGAMVTSHHHADGIILLTGDGDLATAIARDVKKRRPGMKVFAAAIPGTASSRLMDERQFDGFLPLGPEVTKARSCA